MTTTQPLAPIRPCPFCDSADLERRFIRQKYYADTDIHQERALYKAVYYRFCNGCGAHGPQVDKSEDTDTSWNRRSKSAENKSTPSVLPGAGRSGKVRQLQDLVDSLADEVEHAYLHGGYAGGEGTDDLVKDARKLLKSMGYKP